MRWQCYLLVYGITILFCVGLVAGAVTTNASPLWIAANGRDSSNITINVTDDSGTPIKGAEITFNVTDPDYGFVYPEGGNPKIFTDENGTASTVFRSKTKSGRADISVSVNGTIQDYGIVKIDHDTPYLMFVEYNTTAEVGITTPIHVHLQDRWGNPVDNKNIAEEIHFKMASLDPNSTFYGSWQNITYNNSEIFNATVGLPVDSHGDVNISLNLSTAPNDHLIQIDPLVPISDKYISIRSLANGMPYILTQMVDPPSPEPYIRADGNSSGTITYGIYDKYLNPQPGKIIDVETNGWGSYELKTTDNGSVTKQIGPTNTSALITFTATVRENQSLTTQKTVDFYDYTPTTLLLTVNPNSLVSYDQPNSSTALITAAVTDIHGAGSKNEGVNFSVENVSYDGDYTVTSVPHISTPASSTTGLDGYAYGYFIPGGFTTNENDPKYSYSATGMANIRATWMDHSGGNHSEITPVIWKNSPIISVYTLLNKTELTVGDEIQVTLLVKADGPQLQSRPIDVILAMGRDIGMLNNRQLFTKDPMLSTRPAARKFNSFMTPFYDRVGLMTFGDKGWADLLNNKLVKRNYLVGDDGPQGTDDTAVIAANYSGNGRTYPTYVTYDEPLTGNLTKVDQAVDQIMPFNEATSASGDGIPLRKGLYDSIGQLINHGRPNAVKAVIALVDQGFNWYGDPLARGNGETDCSEGNIEKGNPSNQWIAFPCGGPYTGHWTIANSQSDWQNMSNYARDNNIKIFVVSYTDSVSADRQRELDTLAQGTGGFHRHAATEQDLIDIYAEIGEVLRKEAAVNATANMNFTQVRLNNITYPGSAVFDYVPRPNASTVEHRWNSSPSSDWYHNWSQQDDWQDYILSFNIGTLWIGDTWLANFTLKVNRTGIISFPYSPSDVSFEGTGGDTSVLIPVAIFGSQQQTNTQEVSDSLEITDFKWTNSNPATDVIDLEWKWIYSGNQTVDKEIYYFVEGSNIPHRIPRNAVIMNNSVAMYITDLIPSEKYYFRLCVSVPSKPNTEIIVDNLIKCDDPKCACIGPLYVAPTGHIILK